MPAVRKTACIAYRGLVPMSPNTTPRAPRVSAPNPAAPACFAVTPGFEERPSSEPRSVAGAEPSASTPVGVLPVIRSLHSPVRFDGPALPARAPSPLTLGLGPVPGPTPVWPYRLGGTAR